MLTNHIPEVRSVWLRWDARSGLRNQSQLAGGEPTVSHVCQPGFVDDVVLRESLRMNVAQALVVLGSSFRLQARRQNVPGRPPSADGASKYRSADRADVSLHYAINRHEASDYTCLRVLV